jgi:hypothetical protein
MYFGEYLVVKKIIEADDLIKALCYQLENLPSIIRLVFETKIVNSEELLELIKSQIQNDTDILTVLLNQKKINEEKISELELLQMSKKIPLGEALIALKFASVDIIQSALKDYYDNKFNLIETTEKKELNNGEVEISEAALESLKELGMSLEAATNKSSLESNDVMSNSCVPRPFIDQYLDLFTEKYKNKIKKLISIISKEVSGPADISNYFNSLYRDLHLIKGAIVLSELKTQEEIVSIWESQIESALTKNNDEIRFWCKNNLNTLDQTIDLMWAARTQIETDKSDEKLLNNGSFKSEVQGILSKIK